MSEHESCMKRLTAGDKVELYVTSAERTQPIRHATGHVHVFEVGGRVPEDDPMYAGTPYIIGPMRNGFLYRSEERFGKGVYGFILLPHQTKIRRIIKATKKKEDSHV